MGNRCGCIEKRYDTNRENEVVNDNWRCTERELQLGSEDRQHVEMNLQSAARGYLSRKQMSAQIEVVSDCKVSVSLSDPNHNKESIRSISAFSEHIQKDSSRQSGIDDENEEKNRNFALEHSLSDKKSALAEIVAETDPLRNGKDYEYYEDGSFYEGMFKDGMRHGFGKLHWPNHEFYEGEFYMNFRHGKGKMIFSDHSSYYGDWKYDAIDGKGVHRLKNGNTFVGEFVKGRKHGKGVIKYRNGTVYEAFWKKGKEIQNRNRNSVASDVSTAIKLSSDG